MNAVLLATGPLAAVDPEKVKPGWLGLAVVLILCAATYLLWRSMNHQLDKVRFEDGGSREVAGNGGDAAGDDGSVPRKDGDAAAPTDNGNPRA